MKKTIIIEVLLFAAFVTTLVCASIMLYYARNLYINAHDPYVISHYPDIVELYSKQVKWSLSFALPFLASAIFTFAAIIIIAVKDFPVFKPLILKSNAKREARKLAKAEKAEANKQARINKLQAEIDELKKDE